MDGNKLMRIFVIMWHALGLVILVMCGYEINTLFTEISFSQIILNFMLCMGLVLYIVVAISSYKEVWLKNGT